MFNIAFTPVAQECLDGLRKYDQRKILADMDEQLIHQPRQETRRRKRLRPNQLAEYELRVDDFRVFYDVLDDESVVRINAIGYKEGNRLYIRGQEYKL